MTALRSAYATFLFLTALFWVLPAWSAPLQPEAEQVKSAIIINMARYVDWPADAFSSESTPLTICTPGRGRLATALESLQGKVVKGQPVLVRHLGSSSELTGCHLLVLGSEDRRLIAPLLDKARRLPILTIGDLPGFSREGGMVELLLQDGKVRFDINLGAARQSRLKFSSQLLKVARTVLGDH